MTGDTSTFIFMQNKNTIVLFDTLAVCLNYQEANFWKMSHPLSHSLSDTFAKVLKYLGLKKLGLVPNPCMYGRLSLKQQFVKILKKKSTKEQTRNGHIEYISALHDVSKFHCGKGTTLHGKNECMF